MRFSAVYLGKISLDLLNLKLILVATKKAINKNWFEDHPHYQTGLM